jgi:hypothetical protein
VGRGGRRCLYESGLAVRTTPGALMPRPVVRRASSQPLSRTAPMPGITVDHAGDSAKRRLPQTRSEFIGAFVAVPPPRASLPSRIPRTSLAANTSWAFTRTNSKRYQALHINRYSPDDHLVARERASDRRTNIIAESGSRRWKNHFPEEYPQGTVAARRDAYANGHQKTSDRPS